MRIEGEIDLDIICLYVRLGWDWPGYYCDMYLYDDAGTGLDIIVICIYMMRLGVAWILL
jgi:hypothetical protein